MLGFEPIIEVLFLVKALISVDLPELGKPSNKISASLFFYHILNIAILILWLIKFI